MADPSTGHAGHGGPATARVGYLLAAEALVLICASVALAQEPQDPAQAPPPDRVCLLCHDDVRAEHGGGVAPIVHAEVACVECHVALREFDVAEGEHDPDVGEAACTACHAQVSARMERSVHLEAGISCSLCHGSHDIAPVHAADAPVAASRVNALCTRCHSDIAGAGPDDIHSVALAGRTCLACHDPHAAAPPAPIAKDKNCLVCHEDVAGAAPTGAPGTTGSVHDRAGVACVLCHADLREMEEPDHGPLAPVRCGGCHTAAEAAHARGVHGTLLGEGRPAAACQDCHGTHDVQPAGDPRSRVFPLRLPDTCESCHRPEPPADHPAPSGERVLLYETSAHGRGLRIDGLVVTATCASCHGSHEIRHSGDPEAATSRARVPYTCGACHVGLLNGYLSGVHGERFLTGANSVPVCTDCHGEHTIEGPGGAGSSVSAAHVAETCARCHADDDLANTYGFRVTALSWGRSYHGIATALGDGRAANCASCHGFHEIYPSSDPRSRIHPDNLEQTCGTCHRGVGAAFSKVPVHSLIDRESNFIPWIVRLVYTAVVVLTIGAFILFILMDLFGRLRLRLGWGPGETVHVDPETWPDEGELVPAGESFERFSLQARLQHGVLVTSFVLLVLTGLPIFLHELPVMRSLVNIEGGFRVRSLLHRAGAVALVGLSVWHVAGVLFTPGGRRWLGSMLFTWKDLRDFFAELMYDVGLTDWLARRPRLRGFFERHPYWRFDRRPAAGRYGFVEKLEYTAVVWGNVVMIASGAVLWRPDWFLGALPVWVFDVSRVVHGYEATLAFLAIVIWHMYHVHLRPGVFPGSRIWLSGRISRHELRSHHAGEYVEILAQRRALQKPQPRDDEPGATRHGIEGS